MNIQRVCYVISIALVYLGISLVPGQCAEVAYKYECKFSRNQWKSEDWMQVKSPRWDYFGTWIQEPDCIRNQTPPGLKPKQLESADTYSSMLLEHKFSGNVEVSCMMSFESRWAPLIVISDEPGKSKDGRLEYRNHTEIVLYDEGINIWQHYYKDGKPSYIRLAWAKMKFKPKHRYDLKVTITGKLMTVTVDGNEMGCTNIDLPDSYYVGITGCEGINRFYKFKAEEVK